jgi:hypothetical protein
MAMNAPIIIEISGQTIHQSVNQITGTMPVRMLIADGIVLHPFTEFFDFFHHRHRPILFAAPIPERFHALAKLLNIFTAINIPNPLM